MSFTIKFKRGTASEWNNSGFPSGVVLALGEPGYEKDTGKLKIGNGNTPWALLPYVGSGADEETVRDLVAAFIQDGSGISVVHDDSLNTLTIHVTGLNSSYISDFNEAVDDRVGSGLFVGSTGILLSYNDSSNSFVISTTGLQPQGNYSLVGHTHTASDISNFDSSVSGLLPVITNSGDNRLLTSTGTTTGINGESNLTFNGSLLSVTGSGNFTGSISGSLLNIDNIRIDGNTILTTNSDGTLYIMPTGTGALQADIRRNIRGQYSTDWQRSANTNAQVANGSYSTIGGGSDNTASATYSVVAGGGGNSAGGLASTIGGGDNNVANNSFSTVAGGSLNNYTHGAGSHTFVGGGYNNENGSDYSVIVGGSTNRTTGAGYNQTIGGGGVNIINSLGSYNTIAGGYQNSVLGTTESSVICGGRFNTISSGIDCAVVAGNGNTINDVVNSTIINGENNVIQSGSNFSVVGGTNAVSFLHAEQAYSAGLFNTKGDAETRRFILRGRDTTNSTIHLKLDGDLSGSKHLYIPDWTSWYYTIKVIARRNSPIGSTSVAPSSDTGAYRFEGAIENKDNDGSSCALLGNIKTVIHEDDAGWDCNISIMWDGNNKAYLDIECSYDHTTEDVYWVANVEVVQVSVPIEGPSSILACGFGSFSDGPFTSGGYYNDREYYQRDDSGTYYYLFWNGTNWIISSSLGGSALYSSPTYLPVGNNWTVNSGTPAGGDTYDYSVTSTCPSGSSSNPSSSSSSSGATISVLACGFGSFSDGIFVETGTYNGNIYFYNSVANLYLYTITGGGWAINNTLSTSGTYYYATGDFSYISNNWTTQVLGSNPAGDTYDYAVTSGCPQSSSSSSGSGP